MRFQHRIVVEIAVHAAESAVAARAGGADHIELFSNRVEGRVRPAKVSLPLYARM